MQKNLLIGAMIAAVLPLIAANTSAANEQSGATSGATPDQPFSFDAAPGRLPKNVVPSDYTLAITPDLTAHTVSGVESVKLKFREKTNIVQFNSLNQTLSDVRLDGKPVKKVDTDNTKQLTTLTLAAPTKVGLHTLSFKYQGVLESRPFGLFSQSFVTPDGSKDQISSSASMVPSAWVI